MPLELVFQRRTKQCLIFPFPCPGIRTTAVDCREKAGRNSAAACTARCLANPHPSPACRSHKGGKDRRSKRRRRAASRDAHSGAGPGAGADLNVSAQDANVEEAWNALAGDGAVLIMRHAIAPGSGDPPGFRLDDCSTQRNLSGEGRAQAARLGALLRSKGVRITKMTSSPRCRAIDTARSTGFTHIEVNDALWNLVHNPPDREAKVVEARSLIHNWRGPGVLLLSTHGLTLRAVIGASSYPPAGGSVASNRIRSRRWVSASSAGSHLPNKALPPAHPKISAARLVQAPRPASHSDQRVRPPRKGRSTA